MATRNAKGLAELGSWAKRFDKVASPQFKGALTKELSEEALVLVDRSFEKQRSPYGKPWAPKKEPDGKKILARTDALRSSIKSRVSTSSFSISTPLKYGAYHNEGRKGPWDITPKKKGGKLKFFSRGQWWSLDKVEHPGYPARTFMPTASRIPALWIRSFTKITARKFFRVLAKGRKK